MSGAIAKTQKHGETKELALPPSHRTNGIMEICKNSKDNIMNQNKSNDNTTPGRQNKSRSQTCKRKDTATKGGRARPRSCSVDVCIRVRCVFLIGSQVLVLSVTVWAYTCIVFQILKYVL